MCKPAGTLPQQLTRSQLLEQCTLLPAFMVARTATSNQQLRLLLPDHTAKCDYTASSHYRSHSGHTASSPAEHAAARSAPLLRVSRPMITRPGVSAGSSRLLRFVRLVHAAVLPSQAVCGAVQHRIHHCCE